MTPTKSTGENSSPSIVLYIGGSEIDGPDPYKNETLNGEIKIVRSTVRRVEGEQNRLQTKEKLF